MMNPLDVTLSDDPEVLEFMRFCHSRKGMLHIDGTHPLPPEQVPALSDDQLEEFDRANAKLDALEPLFTWENIHDWIADRMWIVSGCYCGGTKFACGFLQKLGIAAEHETLFNIDGRCAGRSMVAARNSVDVSGGASLWLPCFPRAKVIWLVRNPVDTLNSQYHYRKYKDGKTIDLQRDMLARYTMNFAHGPIALWRVESLSDQLSVLRAMGLDPAHLKPGALESARRADRNSKSRSRPENPATWDELIPPLKQWAIDLGYDETGLRKEFV